MRKTHKIIIKVKLLFIRNFDKMYLNENKTLIFYFKETLLNLSFLLT